MAAVEVGLAREGVEVGGLLDGDLEEKTRKGLGFGRSTTLPEI